MVFVRVLLDDLLKHLDSFAALIRQDKTRRQFLSRICVLWLEFQNSQIKRDRFLQLLGCRVIVCYVLEDRGVVSGMFGCSFENLIDSFQFFRFRLRVRPEKNSHVKLSELHAAMGIVTANSGGTVQKFGRLLLSS